MSDIVDRLVERAKHARNEGNITATCDAMHFEEAADELTRLRAQVERMREALGPFSEAAHRINYFEGERYDAPLFALPFGSHTLTELLDGLEGSQLTVGHLRAARAAMEG